MHEESLTALNVLASHYVEHRVEHCTENCANHSAASVIVKDNNGVILAVRIDVVHTLIDSFKDTDSVLP